MFPISVFLTCILWLYFPQLSFSLTNSLLCISLLSAQLRPELPFNDINYGENATNWTWGFWIFNYFNWRTKASVNATLSAAERIAEFLTYHPKISSCLSSQNQSTPILSIPYPILNIIHLSSFLFHSRHYIIFSSLPMPMPNLISSLPKNPV